MQSGVTRARNRSPSAPSAIDKDHVIEQVDGLEAEYEWGIAVLLQDGCGKQGSLEAMNRAGANDPAKSTHREASGLSVIREIVEPTLHRGRSAQPVDELSLGRSEREVGWRDSSGAGKS